MIGADEEIFEMNNGCICCTVRGDLIRIIGTLLKRKDRFDYIVIETTGLADPAPVAQTFFVDDEMKRRLSLDGIVAVVDSKHIWGHLDKSPEAKEHDAGAGVTPYRGELVIAFDPVSFLGAETDRHLQRAERIFEEITSQGARLPSERRYEARARSLASGTVTIPRKLYDDIRALFER